MIQIYRNGHQCIARQLEKRGFDYQFIDNALVPVGDFDQAKKCFNHLNAQRLE